MVRSAPKQNTHALVRWIEDNKISVLKRSDLLVGLDVELELNNTYNAKWCKEVFQVELKFVGTQTQCEKFSTDITYSNISNTPKIKSKSRIEITKDSAKQPIQAAKSPAVETKNDESELIDSYSRQLNERNNIIKTITAENKEKSKKIDDLNNELDTYKQLAGIFCSLLILNLNI